MVEDPRTNFLGAYGGLHQKSWTPRLMSDNALYTNLGLPSEIRVRALPRTFGADLRTEYDTYLRVSSGPDRGHDPQLCNFRRSLKSIVQATLRAGRYPTFGPFSWHVQDFRWQPPYLNNKCGFSDVNRTFSHNSNFNSFPR